MNRSSRHRSTYGRIKTAGASVRYLAMHHIVVRRDAGHIAAIGGQIDVELPPVE